jgi:phosphoglycolate phosphatase
MLRRVKPCLLFDLDGTLVDSLPGIAASLNRTLIAHGLKGHSDTAVRGFVGNGLKNLIRQAAPSGADESLIESMLAFYKPDYDLSWASGTRPYQGIVHMLDELQREGHPLAVLSNKTHDFTQSMVRGLFPSIHFGRVQGLTETMRPKPDPAGALAIALAMDLPPSRCVFIGDSTMDIETAANAGMKSIGVTWGYHDSERLVAAEPDHLAESVDALAQLLRRHFDSAHPPGHSE